MSNRFHNKFHRHNHHTRPTDRDGKYPDSAYDPIASPDSPFEGEFYVDGNITTLSSISALGDLYASNGTFHEDVVIKGNLSVLGTTTQLDTFVYVTSAVDITNVGTGPALKVTQSGDEPIAHFIDSSGDDIIFDNNGYVGLGTMSPNEKLTIIGNVSATGNVNVNGNMVTDGNSFLSGSSFIVNDLTVDTNTLFVDSTDNKVGIGTLEPNQQLTVIGNISATGSQDIDQHLTVGILSAGLTDQVVIHNNNTLESREINSQVWDTAAEFLSGRNLTVGYLPLYDGPNTLVDSPVEYDGLLTVIHSDTTVTGNLTSLGDAYFANTLFTTTSSLSIVNTGPGPALYVYQAAGAYDVASFYDGDGVEVLHVGNSNPSGLGRVGINASSPNKELTVIGSISATEDVDITGKYLSGGVDLSFIIAQNVSSGSSASNDYTHANFLPLSGGTLHGPLSASGNVSTNSQFLSAGIDLLDIFSSITTGGTVSGAYLPLSGGTVTGSVTVTGTVFAQSFVLTTPGLIVFDTVSAAAIPVTTLPILGNDVELYTTTAVTITAFENGIKGTTYTLTNKGTGTITITASPTNFVRNGTSWRSNTRALSTAFLELPTNYSCSLRADIDNLVSVW